MPVMMPIQAYRFRVVPLGREDFAEAFMANVANAEIDLVNRVFRVQVRHTRESITLSAVDYAIKNCWIPELHIDAGAGFENGKMIRFIHDPRLNDKPRPNVTHSLRFDYSDTDVAMHNIEWAFTEFKMEAMDTPPGPQPRAPKPKEDGMDVMTPEEAMAMVDAERAAKP